MELHTLWKTALPGVHPFYAVKCNNDPALLQTLAALGCGFDCASKVTNTFPSITYVNISIQYFCRIFLFLELFGLKAVFCIALYYHCIGQLTEYSKKDTKYIHINFSLPPQAEIKAILDLGVSPERIIYANPCKQASHLKYACRKNVAAMTFDNEVELHKVQRFTSFLLTSFLSSFLLSLFFLLFFVPLTVFLSLSLFFSSFLSLSLFFLLFLSLLLFFSSFCPSHYVFLLFLSLSLFFLFFCHFHCFFLFLSLSLFFSFFCPSHCFFSSFVPLALSFTSLHLCLPPLLFNSSSSTSFLFHPCAISIFCPPFKHTASFPSFSLISSIFGRFFPAVMYYINRQTV